jgi:hypothetical protein
MVVSSLSQGADRAHGSNVTFLLLLGCSEMWLHAKKTTFQAPRKLRLCRDPKGLGHQGRDQRRGLREMRLGQLDALVQGEVLATDDFGEPFLRGV